MNNGDSRAEQLRRLARADIKTYAAEARTAAADFANTQATERADSMSASDSAAPAIASSFFINCLVADTDCMQAVLVLAGYRLCTGAEPYDIPLEIITAARAVQMAHVYAEHFLGSALAEVDAKTGAKIRGTEPVQTSADRLSLLAGLHAAEIMLANLGAPEELRLKALSITNRALLVRAHGAAAHDQKTEATHNNYATELALNPLHVGMVLAGASCADTDAVTPFALALGRSWRQTNPNLLLAKAELTQTIALRWPQTFAPLAELTLPQNLNHAAKQT